LLIIAFTCALGVLLLMPALLCCCIEPIEPIAASVEEGGIADDTTTSSEEVLVVLVEGNESSVDDIKTLSANTAERGDTIPRVSTGVSARELDS